MIVKILNSQITYETTYGRAYILCDDNQAESFINDVLNIKLTKGISSTILLLIEENENQPSIILTFPHFAEDPNISAPHALPNHCPIEESVGYKEFCKMRDDQVNRNKDRRIIIPSHNTETVSNDLPKPSSMLDYLQGAEERKKKRAVYLEVLLLFH